MKRSNKILSTFFISLIILSLLFPMEIFAKNSPAVPTSTLYTDSNSITLKWNKVSGADGYVVSLSKSKSFKTSKRFTVSKSKTKYTLKGLKNGTVYYGRVKSYKIVNKKKYYSKYSTATKVTVGVKKTYIKNLSSNQASITVSCNEVSNVSGYQYRYSKTSDFKNAKTLTSKHSSLTIKQLGGNNGAAQKYYLKVRTYRTINNKNYYSDWSKVKTATTKKVTLPKDAYVTSVSSAINNGSVVSTVNFLIYDSNTTGFQVKVYSNNLYTKLVYTTKTVSSNSVKLTSLKSDSVYYIKVRSVRNLNGVEYYGDWVTPAKNIIATPTTVVNKSKITSLTPIEDNKKVKVTWSKSNESNASYILEVSTSQSFDDNNKITCEYTTTDNYLTVPVEYNFKYYFRVKTVTTRNDKIYYSDWSDVVSLPITDPYAINTAPLISSISATTNSISLKWQTVENADKYVVVYSTSSSFNNSHSITSNTNNLVISDLLSNTKYYVKVKAINDYGRSSSYSTLKSITTKSNSIVVDLPENEVNKGVKFKESGGDIVGDRPFIYGYQELVDNYLEPKAAKEYIVLLKKAFSEIGITTDMSDIDKYLAISKWLEANISYDSTEENYIAYHALKNGKTMCGGYAVLLNDFCYLAGVPCYYISSTAHAENIIKINGYWFIADPSNSNAYVSCYTVCTDYSIYSNDFKELFYDTTIFTKTLGLDVTCSEKIHEIYRDNIWNNPKICDKKATVQNIYDMDPLINNSFYKISKIPTSCRKNNIQKKWDTMEITYKSVKPTQGNWLY